MSKHPAAASPDICVVSGTTALRLPSPLNHRVYADMHHADYRFECGPSSATASPMRVFKARSLLRVLPRYDWVLWIDDDAFFTNFATSIVDFIGRLDPKVVLALADGKVRAQGPWTFVNAGVLLVKNDPLALEFLERSLAVEQAAIRSWWVPAKHGMYTNSDQDAIIYLLHEELEPARYTVVPHGELNARPYHYSTRLDEFFICHFPGVPDKVNAVRRFGDQFGVGPTLIPEAIKKNQDVSRFAEEEFILLPKRRVWSRVWRRLNPATSRRS